MGDDVWGDPDAVLARVEDQVRQAQVNAVKAQQLEADMKTLLGRATSAGREITAGVSASGLLVELTLTERALEWDEKVLAKNVMDTVNAAHRKLGEQAVALSADAFGEDSPVTARLRAEAEARSVNPAEPTIGYV
jgi:KaiC/GvpD/RAD55 family RecA-like ATPase